MTFGGGGVTIFLTGLACFLCDGFLVENDRRCGIFELMKIFGLSFILIGCVSWGKGSDFRRLDPNRAAMQVQLEAGASEEAGDYITGNELSEFTTFLIQEESAPLTVLKKNLEKTMCDEETLPPEQEPLCGRVVFSKPLMVSFMRSGWMTSSAEWLVVVGFVARGSGHELSSHYALIVEEVAEIKLENSAHQQKSIGTLTKTFHYKKTFPYWSQTPAHFSNVK